MSNYEELAREAFEKWGRDRYISFSYDPEQEYADPGTQDGWDAFEAGWQAALDHVRGKEPTISVSVDAVKNSVCIEPNCSLTVVYEDKKYNMKAGYTFNLLLGGK